MVAFLAPSQTGGRNYLAPATPPASSGDTTPPVFTGTITTNSITTNSAVVDWSSTTHTDDVGITDYEYSFNNISWTSTGSTSLSRLFSGLTPSTNYIIYIRAKDLAGNISTSLSTSFDTQDLVDTIPPVFTGTLTKNNLTSSSVTVSWASTVHTDNVGIVDYESSYDNSNWTSNGSVATNKTFSGLTPSTGYVIYIRAKDAAGNVSTALSTSFTTSGTTSTIKIGDKLIAKLVN